MEKTVCPVCGEKLDSHVDPCSKCTACAAEEKRMMEKETPDKEFYLHARDYSVPENYPGY